MSPCPSGRDVPAITRSPVDAVDSTDATPGVAIPVAEIPGVARTHRVYFARDVAGAVIYIGRSGNVENRLKTHRSVSPFWGEVARVDLSNPMTYDDSVEYEAQAIYRERPRHNIHGNPDRDHRCIARADQGRFDAEQEAYDDANTARYVEVRYGIRVA